MTQQKTPPGQDQERTPRRPDRAEVRRGAHEIEHLLRRAGFGVSPDDIDAFGGYEVDDAVNILVNYERIPDDVDGLIGKPGYVGVTSREPFAPNTNLTDARQRWLFRMVHTRRPLQEKMALFWHNHFATAYGKIAGAYGSTEATRMMAAKPSEDPGRVRGHIEIFREMALGSLRDLLVAVAQDPAMIVWLDGRFNVRTRPQENFGREIMELFTMGVGFYTEPDVYAAARVFTGWNLQRVGGASDPTARYGFVYNGNQHDTSAKTFSFPIYADGSQTIPARSESAGMQDGLDLIDALARHPETARRLARKLWTFFVSELADPDPAFVQDLASVYLQSSYALKPVLLRLFSSPQFQERAAYYARYSWPVEFAVRAIKEIGWAGFSVNDAITPLANMGQQLYEPPDVAGWDQGPAWFSSGRMLARMNFAATLARTGRGALVADARRYAETPEAVLSYVLERVSVSRFDRPEYEALLAYMTTGGAWSGSDAQLAAKMPGAVHVVAGSAEYQFV